MLVERKGSDLHLSTGSPPMLRQDGEIEVVAGRGALTAAEDASALLLPITPPANKEEFAARHDTDFAYEIAGLARFRANIFMDRKGPGAVFRVIPSKILTAEELACSREHPRALPADQGARAGHRADRLGQVDDALRDDRLHQPQPHRSHHHDRGPDRVRAREQEVPDQPARGAARTPTSFKDALRAALREDPDIVLVGEMRDLETVAIAIETAETGPPGVRHAAHDDGRVDGRPHHRPVPGRPAGADPHHAVRDAARASIARRCAGRSAAAASRRSRC